VPTRVELVILLDEESRFSRQAGESAAVFLRRAEEALRSAKNSGRNRVTVVAAEANDRNA